MDEDASRYQSTIKDLTGIVGKAMPQTATPENSISGFRRFFFFSENDFATAFLADRPQLATASVSTADPSEPTPGPSMPTPAFCPVEVRTFPKAGQECCQGKEEDGKRHPQRHSSQTGNKKKQEKRKGRKLALKAKRKILSSKEKINEMNHSSEDCLMQ